jgi:hypothetical protein
MYEGWTRHLIVYITHLGILATVPVTGVLYLWARGLLHASVVVGLHGFSEGKWRQLAEMVYWMVLVVATYLQVAIEMGK